MTNRLCCRAFPGRAQEREQEVVEADITGDLPGQHQQNRQDKEQSIGAGRTSHNEVPVEQCAKEGADAHKGTHNQSDTDQNFTEDNQLGKPGVALGLQQKSDKIPIPIKGDGRVAFRWDSDGTSPD